MSDEMQQDTAAAQLTAESGDAPVTESAGQDVSSEAAATETAQIETKTEDRSWQSRYDRLQQEIGRDLQGYVKAFGGGQQIVGFLKQLETLVGNPTLGPVVQNFLKTGQVELPKPKMNEWDEPVQEPEWQKPISSVLAEIQNLKSELQSFKTRQGMSAITEHTNKFLGEYPMSKEEHDQFREYMDSQWGTLSANPNGASILSQMDYRTFKTLALPGIEEFRQQIEARRIQKSRGQLAQKATDAPAQTPVGVEKKPNGAMPQNAEQLRRQVQLAFERAFAG